MLKFSIRYYFFAILLLLSVIFFFKDVTTGLIYSAFFLFGIITINFFRSTFYKGAYFVVLFAITAGYFIRPLILVDHPEMFMYTNIASKTSIAYINKSLFYALISTICIAIGFISAIKFIPEKLLPPLSRDNFMLQNFFIINSIIIVLIVSKLALIISTGAGIKGDSDKDSTLGFILKLLSPDISFVVYYIYLTRYWKKLSLQKKILILCMIVLTSYTLFVTGSKTFIAMFALCFLFNFVLKNRYIKLSTFTVAIAGGFIVLAFSFIMSAAVKFSTSKDIGSIINKAKYFASQESFLLVSDDITKRMMGLDGQIAGFIISDQSNPAITNELKASFDSKEVLLHALNGIIPKVEFTSSPTSGKVISQRLVGVREDVSHAGSLGLFASLYFMSGSYFMFFNLILGLFIAIHFIYARRMRNPDLQFIIYFLACYFVIRVVLSGNFDVILGEFIPKWILLYFYIKLISVINTSIKSSY